MNFYKIIRPLIFTMPAETSHNLAITLLKYGLLSQQKVPYFSELENKIWHIKFTNPVGLAAGFDKNGEAIPALLQSGFGFIEVGTATPLPQKGNDKPRLFRLTKDEAIINRFGFNNQGAQVFANNLINRPKYGVVGANIGKNKLSQDAIADYLIMLEKIYGLSDYITINISSPNTPGLRDLQSKDALDSLLGAIVTRRTVLGGKKIPILVKISPDISYDERSEIAEIILKHGIDGLIVSNTTTGQRDILKSQGAKETGGLSGKPLLAPSTAILRDMYRLTGRKIPIIGVGGISSGDDAYMKIKAGASLVQVYSALIYEGLGLVTRINERLCELLHKDGFKNITDAIGVEVS